MAKIREPATGLAKVDELDDLLKDYLKYRDQGEIEIKQQLGKKIHAKIDEIKRQLLSGRVEYFEISRSDFMDRLIYNRLKSKDEYVEMLFENQSPAYVAEAKRNLDKKIEGFTDPGEGGVVYVIKDG